MRQFNFAAAAFCFTAGLIAQSVPTTINYQGRLTDNTPAQTPITATVSMQFAIYDAGSGGTRLWQEPAADNTGTPVSVTGGIYNYLLGNTVAIPAALFTGATSVRYLQITINPAASAEILTPRQLISANGYANLAQNANSAVSATSFSGSLAGNVTGTQGATVVATVGGQSAANVAAGSVLANAATNANTANAIVKRDGSGNFSAGTITAALAGNASSATALAGNGSNCGAGQYPLGVDAAGNAEACTAVSAGPVPSPFGDGSAGALNVGGNTDWSASPPANANYQFTTCSVAAGVTLTVPSGTLIKCTGGFTLGANAVISVKSWLTGSGGVMVAAAIGAPGLVGIPHFSSNPQVMIPALPAGEAGLIVSPPLTGCGSGIGSGTGVGGLPGGTFGIRAKTGITINAGASIQANATAGTSGGTTGGSGGGGGIVILAWGAGSTLTNSGTVQANGGNGSSNTTRDAGGGGGGIIRLIGPGAAGGAAFQVVGGTAGNTGTGISTSGGGAGGGCGGAGGYAGLGNGTVYLPAANGGTGLVITSAVTDPSGLLVP